MGLVKVLEGREGDSSVGVALGPGVHHSLDHLLLLLGREFGVFEEELGEVDFSDSASAFFVVFSELKLDHFILEFLDKFCKLGLLHCILSILSKEEIQKACPC